MAVEPAWPRRSTPTCLLRRSSGYVELLIQGTGPRSDRKKPTYFEYRTRTRIAGGRCFAAPSRQAAFARYLWKGSPRVVGDLLYGTMFTTIFTGRNRSHCGTSRRRFRHCLPRHPQANRSGKRRGTRCRPAADGVRHSSLREMLDEILARSSVGCLAAFAGSEFRADRGAVGSNTPKRGFRSRAQSPHQQDRQELWEEVHEPACTSNQH